MSSAVAGICVDVNSSAVLLLLLICCLSPRPCWMCGSVLCRFETQAVWSISVVLNDVCRAVVCWDAVTHPCCVILLWFVFIDSFIVLVVCSFVTVWFV